MPLSHQSKKVPTPTYAAGGLLNKKVVLEVDDDFRRRLRPHLDRIICGDVGFGKTEVALRAAAAAVLSGKQVAIAVPTTVLARQHVETFAKRFGPFGIEVGSLSSAVRARGDRGRDGRRAENHYNFKK
jgi:transcription-repair coupling factor (superfamily II helicase)